MRQWIRRVFVFAIALAFMGSGFARAALSATAQEPCHPTPPAAHHAVVEHAATEHYAHMDGAHAGHAAHHDHQHHGGSQKSSGDQACFKCCGLCTAVSAFSPAKPDADVVLAEARVVYSIDSDTCSDRPAGLDPGIPKRTA